jgi:hypothetical protein
VVWQKFTNVSEVLAASIIGAMTAILSNVVDYDDDADGKIITVNHIVNLKNVRSTSL